MFWPDTQTGVDVEPARKTVQSAVRKYFTEGGVGVPPTVPGGDWFNQITNELLNVLAAAGIDPSKADDVQLLEAIKRVSNSTSAREALRRSYLEVGYFLRPIPESFSAGATLASAYDVVLDTASGKAYSGSGPFPQTVDSGTDPTSGLFVDRSGALLTVKIASAAGAGLVGTDSGKTVQYELNSLNSQLTCAAIAKRISDGEAITLAVFGDSTAYGYLVGGPTAQTQDPKNPPHALHETFYYLGLTNVSVINAAVSGSNLEIMLAGTDNIDGLTYAQRIAPGGIAAAASVVYCNHGINHCQSNLSIETYRTDLVRFVKITREAGKVPVLVTPNPINPFEGGDRRETTQIDMYAQVMRDVAHITNCDLVDCYKYTKASAKRVPETVLIPDGIHPCSDLYYQNGRNLAIPLLASCNLSKVGDIASISGSSFLDTMGANLVQRDDTLTGSVLYGSRSDVITAITLPAVLNEPFEYLSFLGLQWVDGARVLTGIWGSGGACGNPYTGKSYGDLINFKWDTAFKCRVNALSGLNLFYFSFDMTDSRPAKNDVVFAGISVPDQTSVSGVSPHALSSAYLNEFSVGVNQKISFSYYFSPDSTGPVFVDQLGVDVAKFRVDASGDMYLDLYSSSGVVSQTLVSGGIAVTSKLLSIELSIYDSHIYFSASQDGIGVTWSVTTIDTCPPICMKTPGVFFTIGYI